MTIEATLAGVRDIRIDDGFWAAARLCFRNGRRIVADENCCVAVQGIVEAHQWAKAHFLVWADGWG